jgi:hypothetical protein
VESSVDVVRPVPSLMHGRIGTEYVVVGEDVGEAQFLGPLAVGADGTAVAAQFCLREGKTYIHEYLSTRAPAGRTSRPRPENVLVSKMASAAARSRDGTAVDVGLRGGRLGPAGFICSAARLARYGLARKPSVLPAESV